MKFKTILIVICVLFLASCASVRFNPETGEVRYLRLGDQQIQGFEAHQADNGTTVIKFKSQQSDAEALTEAIRLIGVLAKPAVVVP